MAAKHSQVNLKNARAPPRAAVADCYFPGTVQRRYWARCREARLVKSFEKIGELSKRLELSSRVPTFARSGSHFANIYQHLGHVGHGFRCRRVHPSFSLPTLWKMLCSRKTRGNVQWRLISEKWLDTAVLKGQIGAICSSRHIYTATKYIFTIYLSRHIYTGTRLRQYLSGVIRCAVHNVHF